MRNSLWFLTWFGALVWAQPALADVETCTTPAGAISCTGTLSIPEHVFLETFSLAGSSTITVQTYGFGGGTNKAGTVIPSGGFDPLVALFSGPANTASNLLFLQVFTNWKNYCPLAQNWLERIQSG